MGFSDLQASVLFYDGSGKAMKITVMRDKEKKVFEVVPKRNIKGHYVIGVHPVTNEVYVNKLIMGGAAQKAGFEKGDIILKLDDKKVSTPVVLQQYVKERTNIPIKIELKRDDKVLIKNVIPERSLGLLMSKPKKPGKSFYIDSGMLICSR
jgi:membrane-associated protease RseP (regulator of RpoE activity)